MERDPLIKRSALALAGLLAVASCGAPKGTETPATPSGKDAGACAVLIGQVSRLLAIETDVASTAGAHTVASSLVALERSAVEIDAIAQDLSGFRSSDPALVRAVAAFKTALDGISSSCSDFSAATSASIANLGAPERAVYEASSKVRERCKRGASKGECAALVALFDGAANEDEYVAIKLVDPTLKRAREDVIRALRTAKQSGGPIEAASASFSKGFSKGWKDAGVQIHAIAERCEGTPMLAAGFRVAAKPEPRSLTLLVEVTPSDAFRKVGAALQKGPPEIRDLGRAVATQFMHGTGFVVVTDGEQPFIVTNRHVVEAAGSVQLANGQGQLLGKADVVYIDARYDLAVLAPTGSEIPKEGFALDFDTPADEKPIVTYGFPALGNRPSYQATRGYVSNHHFLYSEGNAELPHIQHSAPIDPGSSGGPLVNERGAVVGVNRLKVVGRDGVGLAIPAAEAVEVLRRARGARALRSQELRRRSLRLACLEYVGAVQSQKDVSVDLLARTHNEMMLQLDGAEYMASLDELLKAYPSLSASPFAAVRIATLLVARRILARASGVSSVETCEGALEANAQNPSVSVPITLRSGRRAAIGMNWQAGQWLVSSLKVP